MSPLNKTKNQHIFLEKKNCGFANKKVTHFFSKNNCACAVQVGKNERQKV